MIYFVNPIQNPNVGDIAIFYSTSTFFKENGLEYKIVNKSNYKNITVSKNDIVALCGGGWLGIYDDCLIEFFYDIIEKYHEKAKVILMPSSFEPIKESFLRISKCKCTIFARDMNSFENYKKYFLNSKIIYCPDMAYRLPKLNYRKDISTILKKEIVIYDRNDAESVNGIKELLNYGISKSRLNKFIKCDYNLDNAFNYIGKQIFEISKYKLVITDTLHMSIFSYLLNIPCLYLDNSYNKVSNTWKEYNQTIVQKYDTFKKLNIKAYNFGNEKLIFKYDCLLNEFTSLTPSQDTDIK